LSEKFKLGSGILEASTRGRSSTISQSGGTTGTDGSGTEDKIPALRRKLSFREKGKPPVIRPLSDFPDGGGSEIKGGGGESMENKKKSVQEEIKEFLMKVEMEKYEDVLIKNVNDYEHFLNLGADKLRAIGIEKKDIKSKEII